MNERPVTTSPAEQIGDRLLGARIVAIEGLDDGRVRLEFEHKGTDDDMGTLTLTVGEVRFYEVCPTCDGRGDEKLVGGDFMHCLTCGGEGRVPRPVPSTRETLS